MELLSRALNLLVFSCELAAASVLSVAGLAVFSVLIFYIRDFILFAEEAFNDVAARIKGLQLANIWRPSTDTTTESAQRVYPHLISPSIVLIRNPRVQIQHVQLRETHSVYVAGEDASGRPTVITTTNLLHQTRNAALGAMDKELQNGTAVVLQRPGTAEDHE